MVDNKSLQGCSLSTNWMNRIKDEEEEEGEEEEENKNVVFIIYFDCKQNVRRGSVWYMAVLSSLPSLLNHHNFTLVRNAHIKILIFSLLSLASFLDCWDSPCHNAVTKMRSRRPDIDDGISTLLPARELFDKTSFSVSDFTSAALFSGEINWIFEFNELPAIKTPRSSYSLLF
jgi:hypothetical protein